LETNDQFEPFAVAEDVCADEASRSFDVDVPEFVEDC